MRTMSAGSLASFHAAGAMGDVDPEPPTKGAGPRCGRCFKFVPLDSIEWTPQADVDEGAPEAFAVCKTHGRVEVDL